MPTVSAVVLIRKTGAETETVTAVGPTMGISMNFADLIGARPEGSTCPKPVGWGR